MVFYPAVPAADVSAVPVPRFLPAYVTGAGEKVEVMKFEEERG